MSAPRLPLILSASALAVALVSSPLAASAARAVGFARNAGAVNGIKASRTPRANRLLPLGADGRFPASVVPDRGAGATGATGATGPAGPAGAPGAAGPAGPLLDVLPSGKTMTGMFDANAYLTAGQNVFGVASYPLRLSTEPVSANVVNWTGPYTADCPAVGHAAAGRLCLYVSSSSNISSAPTASTFFTYEYGFTFLATAATTTWTDVRGSWATTAA